MCVCVCVCVCVKWQVREVGEPGEEADCGKANDEKT